VFGVVSLTQLHEFSWKTAARGPLQCVQEGVLSEEFWKARAADIGVQKKKSYTKNSVVGTFR